MKCRTESLLYICSLCAYIHSVYSSSVLPIEGKLLEPGSSSLPANVKISLNGEQYTTLTRRDGSFTFFNIPEGIYLLDVLSPDQIYSQVKLKVSPESGTVVPVEYKYPGAARSAIGYPLVLTPLVKVSYFQKKEPFSLYKIIMGNKMMVMMVVSFGVMFLFPKLLSGMDKEQMKELMAQQKEQGLDGDPSAALKKLFGMETKDDEDDD
mmetsp:Transcript_23855/g.34992  ORF Transcript_23855/g.34992 Transcript_23855/m.34992 type:complete len:208 (-) Transcript_23855:90-713(-)